MFYDRKAQRRARFYRKNRKFLHNLKSQAGMSMIEMIIVMSLVAGLTVVIVGAVTGGATTARISETEIGFGTIKNSLMMYKLHMKHYPTTEEGLQALVNNSHGASGWRGPYIEEAALSDAWGIPVVYERVSNKKFTLQSAGPDEEPDTEDDLSYPKVAQTAAN